MVDPNLKNFRGRVGRIARIHDKGGGFEAEGTLGMTYYNSHRPRRRQHRIIGALVVITAVLFCLKAGMYVTVGADVYAYRVAALASGTPTDRIGAYILQTDPVTLALAAQFRKILP